MAKGKNTAPKITSAKVVPAEAEEVMEILANEEVDASEEADESEIEEEEDSEIEIENTAPIKIGIARDIFGSIKKDFVIPGRFSCLRGQKVLISTLEEDVAEILFANGIIKNDF